MNEINDFCKKIFEEESQMPDYLNETILSITGGKTMTDTQFKAKLDELYPISDAEYKPLKELYARPRNDVPFGPRIKKFLAGDYISGEWNSSLFIAACEFYRRGVSEEFIINELSKITGSLDKKDLGTIQSAIKAVERKRNEKA